MDSLIASLSNDIEVKLFLLVVWAGILALGFYFHKMVMSLLLLGLMAQLWQWLEVYTQRARFLWHVPGPTPLPFIGNKLMFWGPQETNMPILKQGCIKLHTLPVPGR